MLWLKNYISTFFLFFLGSIDIYLSDTTTNWISNWIFKYKRNNIKPHLFSNLNFFCWSHKNFQRGRVEIGKKFKVCWQFSIFWQEIVKILKKSVLKTSCTVDKTLVSSIPIFQTIPLWNERVVVTVFPQRVHNERNNPVYF